MSELVRRLERRIAAVPVPGRLLGALLVVVFLAFGAFLGRVTRPQEAAARAPIEVQTPVANAPATTTKQPPISKPTSTPTGEAGKKKTADEEPEAEASSGTNSPTGAQATADDKTVKAKAKAETKGASKAKATLPAIKHVFLIVLDDAAYAEVFGPESKGPYLAKTLEKQGKLLERFYAIAHQQLPDGIALISGQGPTEATAEDCPVYEDISPASSAADGQVVGKGCVYPSSVQTVASQLSEKQLTWRAYVEDLNGSETSTCAHPALGAEDPTAALGMPSTSTTTTSATTSATMTTSAAAAVSEPLAGTFRDPFVYFDSVIDSKACAADVVGLKPLTQDLKRAGSTPNLSYIVPDLCEDGSTKPCAAGRPDGMGAADGFLKRVVPKILAAPAYRQNGLLVITVDEAPSTGEFADSSSCCGEPHFPDLPAAAGSVNATPGGGEVGALLLSPFVKGGGISQETYNDFSLLRTIENVFELEPLGYAALSEVKPLSPSLFSSE